MAKWHRKNNATCGYCGGRVEIQTKNSCICGQCCVKLCQTHPDLRKVINESIAMMGTPDDAIRSIPEMDRLVDKFNTDGLKVVLLRGIENPQNTQVCTNIRVHAAWIDKDEAEPIDGAALWMPN